MTGFAGNDHPALEELLLWADREMEEREVARIEEHLAACWACRAKTGKIEQTISSLIEYEETVLKPNFPPPPGNWRGFDSRMRQYAEMNERPSLFSRWVAALRRVQPGRQAPRAWRWSAVAVAVSLLFLVVLRNEPEQTVSAAELLQKAEAKEAEALRAVAQPVIYQKLKARRRATSRMREESIDLELWRDTAHARQRLAVLDRDGRRLLLESNDHSALWRELEQVYRINRLDWRRPLSPAAWRASLASVAQSREVVIRARSAGGQEALTLSSMPRNAGGMGTIIEARLIVRASDWHVVEQYVRVRWEDGEREYELSEAGFEIVSLDAVGPALFSEPAPEANVAASPKPKPSAAGPIPRITPSLAPLPTAAELAAAEVAARLALHRLGADLGEPIEVTQQPDRIEVRGLAETLGRKQELLGALQWLPLVRAEIRTVAEAAMETGQRRDDETSEKTTSGAPPVEVATGRFPLQAALRKYFAEKAQTVEPEAVRRKVDEFANRAMDFSSGAMAQAWALRRLAERYTAAELARLTPESRRHLEIVIRNHVAALRRRVEGSRNWLRPALESLGDDGHLSAGLKPNWPDDWPGFAQAVFGAAQHLDRLTEGLFAGAESPGQNTNQQARALLTALQELDSQLHRLEPRVAGEFLTQ